MRLICVLATLLYTRGNLYYTRNYTRTIRDVSKKHVLVYFFYTRPHKNYTRKHLKPYLYCNSPLNWACVLQFALELGVCVATPLQHGRLFSNIPRKLAHPNTGCVFHSFLTLVFIISFFVNRRFVNPLSNG